MAEVETVSHESRREECPAAPFPCPPFGGAPIPKQDKPKAAACIPGREKGRSHQICP